MIQDLLLLVFSLVAARAFWRLVGGVIDGFRRGPRTGGVPERGVQMVRDPVCGTYVIPERAVTLAEGGGRLFFCSIACRDKYRARPSTGSGHPEPAEGRTA